LDGNFCHWKGLELVCQTGWQDSAGIEPKKAGPMACFCYFGGCFGMVLQGEFHGSTAEIMQLAP
jgi:hypothetical protein